MLTSELGGRSAVITGSSRGLGLAIAVAFAQAGANVMIVARDRSALQAAENRVRESASPGTIVTSRVADVSQPHDVQGVVDHAVDLFGSLQVLVSNAAVQGPIGRLENSDWDEWRHAVEINLFGPVLLCRAVIPHFRNQRYGKVIQLSGGGATGPRPYFTAYATAKAAVVRFIETLAEELRDSGVWVNALAPGALPTALTQEILVAGPDIVGAAAFEDAQRAAAGDTDALDRAARLAVFLASSSSDGITGRLISAVWDPWPTLSLHADELSASDVYTLRRIVPSDRGMNWGP